MNSVRKKTLSHQVYSKKTHTDRYLNVGFHHHLTQKHVILKTLITRALHNSSPQFLPEEKSHLTKAFMSNGYSFSWINQYFLSTNTT